MISKTARRFLIISLSINILVLLGASLFVYKKGGGTYIFNQAQTVFKHKPNTIESNPYYLDKKSVFDELKINSQDIVFLGDSLTNRNEWAESFRNGRIKNRGIDGDTTKGVYNRLDTILEGEPAKIFLMIGTNDLGNMGEDVPTVIKNYTKIIEVIKEHSPSTKVYIENLLPVHPDLIMTAQKNEDIQKINKKLKQVSGEQNLTYIDLNSLLKNKEGILDNKYTNDGLHLNAEGYLVWENAVKEYLDN